MNTLKTIVVVTILGLVAGCATTRQVQITANTKPVAVPILYSPEPPVVARPDLPIQTMTPDKAKVDGEVVKAYAATVEALLGYSQELEDIIAQYKDVHDSYATLAAKLAADWKAKTGQDLDIPTQDTQIKPPVAPTK